MNQKKNVLHFITSLARAGAENILEMIATQHNQDYNHYVVSLGKDNARAPDFEKAKCPLLLLDGNVNPSSFSKIDFKPDFIMGWMYHANITSLYYKKFYQPQAKLIWSIRQGLDNYSSLKKSTKAIIHLGRWTSGMPDKITYNGQKSMRQHEEFGYKKSKSVYLPNGVNLNRFHKSSDNTEFKKKWNLPVNSKIILTAARHSPDKNYPLFFDGLKRVLPSFNEYHVLCMGLGLEPEKKEAILKSHNMSPEISNRIHFIGRQEKPEDFFQSADIFCLTSSTEAFSNSLLEAMSAELAIVTSDAGDSRTIVNDSALVFESGHLESFSKQLNKLISDKDLQQKLSQMAKARATKEFSQEKLFSNFDQLMN